MSTLIIDQSSITSYGCNRSVVRKIATILQIDTGQRVYIQLPHVDGSYSPSPTACTSRGGMFDLSSLLKDPSLLLCKQLSLGSIGEEEEIERHVTEEETLHDNKATKRISSLEAELARLKAQIATYALKETEHIPDMAPPPPPPPPVFLSSSSITEPNTTVLSTSEATPSRPPLTSVLKDLGSVRLKTVGLERSPGGTPFKPKRSQSLDNPSMDDPASIIAHALRKKFSHRIFQDSPDLDRSESSFNEFDSPISGTSTSKTLQFDLATHDTN